MNSPGPARLAALLTLGILAVSSGSILIRLAAAPALAVAAWRVSWATVLLAPFVGGARRELARLTRPEWGRLLAAGIALAFHFALWIASLDHTSVASSVLLVDTTPFFIGLASTFLLRRPSPRSFWAGLTVAFLGCAVIFQADWSESADSLRGNLLALAGALAMALYLMAGGRARQRLSLLAYVWPVYGIAAVVLSGACLAAGVPLTGFSGSSYLFMFLVGLVPQSIGHTTYNWALRWIPPALVALIGLAEPVGASILAWIFLGEAITWSKAAGGAIVLSGIYMAAGGSRAGAGKSAGP